MSESRARLQPRRRVAVPPPDVAYSSVELPNGRLLPIEVRAGARVLRFVPPDSPEGRRLLASGRVTIERAEGPSSSFVEELCAVESPLSADASETTKRARAAGAVTAESRAALGTLIPSAKNESLLDS